jgi:hypothetical protein
VTVAAEAAGASQKPADFATWHSLPTAMFGVPRLRGKSRRAAKKPPEGGTKPICRISVIPFVRRFRFVFMKARGHDGTGETTTTRTAAEKQL